VVKRPTPMETTSTPTEFPQVAPDLYPTSDIRFVMLEIGKLTSKVDRLIADVSGHGEKVEDIRHQISFVRGALWVVGGMVGLLLVAIAWYFTGHLSITVSPPK